MITYKIIFNPEENDKPSISFGEGNDYWYFNELNSCNIEYILDDVLPSIESIWKGEKYWDSFRSPTYGPFDSYEFGFDATSIDFGKERSIVSYGFGEGTFEVASEEIYKFMKEWGSYLKSWEDKSLM